MIGNSELQKRMAEQIEFALSQTPEALAAENAKLWEQGERLFDKTLELSTENAKLRELLQRTWDAFHDATACEFVTVKNELRELGVEVDE